MLEDPLPSQDGALGIFLRLHDWFRIQHRSTDAAISVFARRAYVTRNLPDSLVKDAFEIPLR